MSAKCQFVPGARSWIAQHGDESRYPSAARILLVELQKLARRKGTNRLEITDGMLAQLCGFGYRWVQKALRQLEDLRELDRIRGRGRRFIVLLGTYAGTEVGSAARQPDKGRPPAKRGHKPRHSEPAVPVLTVAPAECVPDPAPTPEEMAAFKAEVARIGSERRCSSGRSPSGP